MCASVYSTVVCWGVVWEVVPFVVAGGSWAGWVEGVVGVGVCGVSVAGAAWGGVALGCGLGRCPEVARGTCGQRG